MFLSGFNSSIYSNMCPVFLSLGSRDIVVSLRSVQGYTLLDHSVIRTFFLLDTPYIYIAPIFLLSIMIKLVYI